MRLVLYSTSQCEQCTCVCCLFSYLIISGQDGTRTRIFHATHRYIAFMLPNLHLYYQFNVVFVLCIAPDYFTGTSTVNCSIVARCLTLLGISVDCDQYSRLIQHGMIDSLGNITSSTSSCL